MRDPADIVEILGQRQGEDGPEFSVRYKDGHEEWRAPKAVSVEIEHRDGDGELVASYEGAIAA